MQGTDTKSCTRLVSSVAFAAALLAGCSSGGGDGQGVGTTANTAVLTTTDFQTGRLATVSLTPPYTVGTNLEDIGSDPVLRVFDGKVDVVNRSDGENVQVIDPAQGFATTAQWSAGNGANPQDVLVRGSTAFVPRYNEGSADEPFSDVLVLNLTDGSTIGAIDMRPYADTATDPSMLPRPYSVLEADGLAWVLLQQIDPSFTKYGVGCFVLVDPASRAVVGAVVLDVQSPNSAVRFGDSIYVAANGQFSIPPTLSGGVVKVDVATRAAELLIDDDDLGSNVSDVAVVSESKGYVVVANVDESGTPAGTNDVRVFDPRTGAVGATVYTCPGFLPDIAWNGDSTLVVACQDFTHPGAVLVDTITDAVVAGPLDTGLPPFSIGFLP